MICAVIQAGGKGTRLHPYTTVLPKPLMPMDRDANPGNHREATGLSRLPRPDRDGWIARPPYHGGAGRWLALRRASTTCARRSRATIGALSGLHDVTKPILVLNGDLLTDFDYREFMECILAEAAICRSAPSTRKFPCR